MLEQSRNKMLLTRPTESWIIGGMKLGDYLEQNDLEVKEFADQIGMSAEAIRLYVAGRRVPRPEAMAKIIEATGGKVEPNDFFPSPDPAERLVPRYGTP